ncbi:hypothetical protein BU17DRAFT_60018 [Hysterangium stoloniferum]|nr:hypothetical protein BU17DRAFT_60018 [Hysterangium stoloniferum]
MSEPELCLCQSICTKKLSSQQRRQHRQIAERQAACISGSSSDSETSASSCASRKPTTKDRNIPYMQDEADLGFEIMSPTYSRHEHEQDGGILSDVDANMNEDSPGDNGTVSSCEIEDSDDESEIFDDEVTMDDLVKVLEERFGDEWQQLLHNLRSEEITDEDLDNIMVNGLIVIHVNDVFDSENYWALCEEYVIVKGVRMGFKFFEGQRDIALGVSTDGFQIFTI